MARTRIAHLCATVVFHPPADQPTEFPTGKGVKGSLKHTEPLEAELTTSTWSFLKQIFVKSNHQPSQDSRYKRIDFTSCPEGPRSHIARDVEQLEPFLLLSYHNHEMLSLNKNGD